MKTFCIMNPRFVQSIDNWSVCDSFCAGLKITQNHKECMWEFLQPYFESNSEYVVRFTGVMILNYYVDDVYLDAIVRETGWDYS